MNDRIQSLVKRIADTRPVQSQRRHEIAEELRALRAQLDPRTARQQFHNLDAALLLLEFMGRSEEVATADTLQIVASLVATVEARHVRAGARPTPPAMPGVPAAKAHAPLPASAPAPHADVTEHGDLRQTHGFLLGTVLLQAGVITPASLSRALQLHASSGQPLGQCLVLLGAATQEQIQSAIAYQDRLREAEHGPRPGDGGAPHLRPPEPRPVARETLQLTPKQQVFVQSMNAQVLGEVLIRLGCITREQLGQALHLQRAANIHIGEALVQTGATTWDHVKRALEVQRRLRHAAA